jgi:hypothetical protein
MARKKGPSMNGDGKLKEVFAIASLAALCGISINFILISFWGSKHVNQKMWQEIALAIVRSPILGYNENPSTPILRMSKIPLKV